MLNLLQLNNLATTCNCLQQSDRVVLRRWISRSAGRSEGRVPYVGRAPARERCCEASCRDGGCAAATAQPGACGRRPHGWQAQASQAVGPRGVTASPPGFDVRPHTVAAYRRGVWPQVVGSGVRAIQSRSCCPRQPCALVSVRAHRASRSV